MIVLHPALHKIIQTDNICPACHESLKMISTRWSGNDGWIRSHAICDIFFTVNVYYNDNKILQQFVSLQTPSGSHLIQIDFLRTKTTIASIRLPYEELILDQIIDLDYNPSALEQKVKTLMAFR